MGVLSVSKGKVWQGNSGLIRMVLDACEDRLGNPAWIQKARWDFETFKHWPLDDAEPSQLREVREIANEMADMPENAALRGILLELSDLIEGRLHAP